MPLVSNALGGRHTDTQTSTYTDMQTKAISGNQVYSGYRPERAWFNNVNVEKCSRKFLAKPLS